MPLRLRSIFQLLGFVFVIVLSGELFLRMTGHLIVIRDKGFGDLSADQNKIRILVLGESTTDARFANGRSWPIHLEEMLLKKGHAVRIYNVAKVGSSSPDILKLLPEHIKKIRPHIVIAMLGINDAEFVTAGYSDPPLKLQKFFRLLSERINYRLQCSLEDENSFNLRNYLLALNESKNPACLEISSSILKCGVNLSDEFLELVATCHRTTNTPLPSEALNIRGMSLISGSGIVFKNYKEIKKILNENKIQLVAMQYPTLSTEGLRQIFKESEDVIFVSNKENFREAVEKHSYDEIFVDRFRESWGHTTEFGHSLLATSVSKAVEPLVIRLSLKDKP